MPEVTQIEVEQDFLTGTSNIFFLALADELVKFDWPC